MKQKKDKMKCECWSGEMVQNCGKDELEGI